MTELHVGEGRTYTTLAKAAATARPGDAVIVHAGVYRETLKPPAGTTWAAAPGERPIVDGGWNGSKVSPEDARAVGILIDEPGVTLRGLEIRNVRGKGIAVAGGGDNFLMEDCYVHHTANGGMNSNGTGTLIHGVTIRNCRMEYLSMTGQWYETPVNGCCLHRYVIGLRVEGLNIRYGYGEGFALGPFTEDAIISGLVVEDTAHLGVYASNRARNVLFENCVIIQRGLADWRQGDGDVGGGFVIGDEVSGLKTAKWPHADNIVLRRCLTVNAGAAGIAVRNQKKISDAGTPDGYDTRPDEFLVENCTFVGGPDSRGGAGIIENQHGGRVTGVLRNNVFVLDKMAAGSAQVRNTAAGVRFENNVWTAGVPAGLPGSNVRVPALALVAPFAMPPGTFALDNYRPVAGGSLDGAGMGALEALPIPTVDAWVMADFEQQPSAGPAPLTVTFADRSTAGGNAVITTWAWEFGDGTTSAEPNPVHVYATPGTYRARLTVADEGRALSTFVVGPEIVVAEVEPEPPEEPWPPESIWDNLLELAAALGEHLVEMDGKREAAEASLAEAERQLAALAEGHDVAAGLLGELLLSLDEYRPGDRHGLDTTGHTTAL